MNSKLYLDTLHLVEALNSYREEQKKEMIDEENEMCELYFALEDKSNDKRGSF